MHLTARPPLARLDDLEREIKASAVAELPPYAETAETWHCAGTFVTDDAFALTDSPAARAGDLGVLTRHARPLSWLFFSLREPLGLTPAGTDVRNFFGRLADAANGFLAAHQPEEEDWRPLLLAVVREARRAFRESYLVRHEPARTTAHVILHPAARRVRRPLPAAA